MLIDQPTSLIESGYKNFYVSRSRSHDASTGSLSNTQLAEHYANCIKLSSQNVSGDEQRESVCVHIICTKSIHHNIKIN